MKVRGVKDNYAVGEVGVNEEGWGLGKRIRDDQMVTVRVVWGLLK